MKKNIVVIILSVILFVIILLTILLGFKKTNKEFTAELVQKSSNEISVKIIADENYSSSDAILNINQKNTEIFKTNFIENLQNGQYTKAEYLPATDNDLNIGDLINIEQTSNLFSRKFVLKIVLPDKVRGKIESIDSSGQSLILSPIGEESLPGELMTDILKENTSFKIPKTIISFSLVQEKIQVNNKFIGDLKVGEEVSLFFRNNLDKRGNSPEIILVSNTEGSQNE